MSNSKWKATESVEKDSTAKCVWSEGKSPATNVASSAESSSTDLASAATQLRFLKFQKKHQDPMVLVWSNGGSDGSMKGTIDGVCTHHLPRQYFIPSATALFKSVAPSFHPFLPYPLSFNGLSFPTFATSPPV
ncbi:hypothetical protein BS47DRAFT_1394703 [Hydnum rufescens UP504]|uniref:Uncharacterized protein n=1 Tax=Hydnum rufescens UP504 TaxID=1448309 RepID=A0A9P6DR69_9AGAM|nr:hypothetical protein BS47DRAFT_1394703 [Hydnum rufescens UP504]